MNTQHTPNIDRNIAIANVEAHGRRMRLNSDRGLITIGPLMYAERMWHDDQELEQAFLRGFNSAPRRATHD